MSDDLRYHRCDRQARRPLVDARGIFCCYVCDICEAEKRRRYRPEIFTDPDYDTMGEAVDDDDWVAQLSDLVKGSNFRSIDDCREFVRKTWPNDSADEQERYARLLWAISEKLRP